MNRLYSIGLLLLLAVSGFGATLQRVSGFCTAGAVQGTILYTLSVVTPNFVSAYPGCTVKVFQTGTQTPIQVYSDPNSTPLAQPFTADIHTGYWSFYTNSYGTVVDVNMSGGGFPKPYTYPYQVGIGTPVPIANGGTGTATPGDTAGDGINIANSWPNNLISANIGPGQVFLNHQISTVYQGLDAMGFCTTPSAPDVSCVNNAITAGIAINSTIVVSKPINVNGNINLPGGWYLVFMPSLNYTTTGSPQISMGVWSKVSCPGGPFATVFNFTSSATGGTGFIDTTAGGFGQGATVEGCGFSYSQPSQTVRTSMIHYPPTILGSQATTFRDNNIFQAWDGIDCTHTPYCGQMLGENNRISTFDHGLAIDNSLDTVRWNNNHHWPWGFAGDANKLTAYEDSSNFGVFAGRVDGFQAQNDTFYIGQGMVVNTGTGGVPGFGSLTNCGFDTFNGMLLEGGTYSMQGGYISILPTTAVGWFQNSGTASLNGVNMTGSGGQNFVNLGGGQLQINGGNASFALMSAAPFLVQSANADFRAMNMVLNSDNVDQTIFSDVAGQMTVAFSRFLYRTNTTFSHPKAVYSTSGSRGQFGFNTATDVGTGTVPFVQVVVDSQINILYNQLLGAQAPILPSSHSLLQSVGNQ